MATKIVTVGAVGIALSVSPHQYPSMSFNDEYQLYGLRCIGIHPDLVVLHFTPVFVICVIDIALSLVPRRCLSSSSHLISVHVFNALHIALNILSFYPRSAVLSIASGLGLCPHRPLTSANHCSQHPIVDQGSQVIP
jgi:hypothetical protein